MFLKCASFSVTFLFWDAFMFVIAYSRIRTRLWRSTPPVCISKDARGCGACCRRPCVWVVVLVLRALSGRVHTVAGCCAGRMRHVGVLAGRRTWGCALNYWFSVFYARSCIMHKNRFYVLDGGARVYVAGFAFLYLRVKIVASSLRICVCEASHFALYICFYFPNEYIHILKARGGSQGAF